MQPKICNSPVSNGKIRSKYRKLTSNILSSAWQRKMEDLVMDLEHLKDIMDLRDLLSGVVTNPLAWKFHGKQWRGVDAT